MAVLERSLGLYGLGCLVQLSGMFPQCEVGVLYVICLLVVFDTTLRIYVSGFLVGRLISADPSWITLDVWRMNLQRRYGSVSFEMIYELAHDFSNHRALLRSASLRTFFRFLVCCPLSLGSYVFSCILYKNSFQKAHHPPSNCLCYLPLYPHPLPFNHLF